MKRFLSAALLLTALLLLVSCGQTPAETEKKTYAGDGWSAVYKP